MSNLVCTVSVALSVLNWLLFAILVAVRLRAFIKHPPPAENGVAAHDALLDQLGDEGAKLAAAFKAAGPTATAAALSVLFMAIAALAAGLGDLHTK